MKRQTTAVILLKLFAGLSFFTGIIAVIFFTFLFVSPQKTKNPPLPSISPTLSPTVTPREQGKFCGGIAGIKCPDGYSCQLSGNYPDAGGICIKQDKNKK